MRFIELFAGAGGMGLGLEAAGMEHLLSFEKGEAPHSVLVHAGKLALQMDLSDVGDAAIAMRTHPDLIVGGPPCQDFSVQGDQVEAENARLTRNFAQIICLTRPEWFLFENVTRAAKSREYQAARGLWKRHGYGLTEVTIDACEYGVPQMRKRFFCVGRLHEIDGFLKADIEAARSQKPMTVRDILDPRRFPEDKVLLDKGFYFVQPWRGSEGEPNGRGVLSLDEPCFTISRHTRDKASSSYIRHKDDAGDVEEAPLLTSSQVARIQGFPSDYDFRRKQFAYAREGWPAATVDLMIANAVPAPVAERIGKVIFARHHALAMPKLDKGFTAFLYTKRGLDPVTREGLSKRAVDNIRSHVNRGIERLGGRMYSNPYLLLQALETSVTGDGKFSDLSTRLQSDLRQCLLEYHAYLLQLPPSKWAPKRKTLPEFRERYRVAKKPGRRKRKGADIAPAAPHPTPDRKEGVKWPLPYRPGTLDLELAQIADLFDDGFRDDPYAPQPPAADPSEDWRPDGYDDPRQDPEYLEYLQSLKADD